MGTGIITRDPEWVQKAMNAFDKVWTGTPCGNGGRKDPCVDYPMDTTR